MILAGLDIATVTGKAIMDEDRVVTTSTFKAKVGNDFLEGAAIDPMREGEIGLQFENDLYSWLVFHKVTHVAIEAPISSNPTRTKTTINPEAAWAGRGVVKEVVGSGSIKAVFRAYGLEMIACSVCRRLNIPVYMVSQGTWRKEFLGDGRAKDAKDRAVVMCAKLGITITSKDAAEAAGVVTWLDRKLNPHTTRRGNDLFDSSLSQ